ncbi:MULTISPECIES: VOC family protein [unclassified Embleya]|uniref:VOC family protein n=1 Tax=unclassified Embleya TaxID=2699296 RepID=UPI0033F4F31B
MFRTVRTVMVFAGDPRASARWWAEVLDVPARFDIDEESVYAWVDIAGVELGFHPADPARNPPGGSTVPYWGVADLDAIRDRLLAAGCVHHRGPLVIEPGRRICQLVDPFGFVFGLEGP